MIHRVKRLWCRVNDHELGEKTISVDHTPNGWAYIVYSHVCLCGLYFIDDWGFIDSRRAGK